MAKGAAFLRERIFVVEDDAAISGLVAMTLSVAGYETACERDGGLALERITRERFDLVILDIMLPGLDGFAILERLRGVQDAPPVLALTARGDVLDRVRGLRLGAEDYMVKPFHPIELQARAEGILARRRKGDIALSALDVTVDEKTREVRKAGAPVELTPQEYALLCMLMRHRNMALSREQLLEAAWGYDYAGGTRTVDMHIQRLRKKLCWEERIKTVYKLGYRLEAPS